MKQQNINEIVKTWEPVLSKGNKFKNDRVKRATAIMLQNEIDYLAETRQISVRNISIIIWAFLCI